MNPNDYVDIVPKTAIFPDTVLDSNYEASDYTTLGLISEIGEVASVVKKMYRDNEGLLDEKTRDRLIAELGDCYWYVAACCKVEDVSFTSAFNLALTNPLAKLHRSTDLISMSYGLISSGQEVVKNQLMYKNIADEDRDKQFILNTFASIILKLNLFCACISSSYEDVLEYNYRKLMSRLINNSLKGSGDDR